MTGSSGRGESWLSIGGVVFHIASDDHELGWAPGGPLQTFFTPPRPADIELRASWSDGLAEPDGVTLFESGGAWRAVRDDANLVFSCRSSLRLQEPYVTARFDASFDRGEVRVNRRYFPGDAIVPISPIAYPLDELMTVHALAMGKGIEVHGCGVLDRTGDVYVFAGQSGAGKSTIARMWADEPGVTILSDERLVLRTDGDGVRVYGTPWHGDAALLSSRHGELAGLFFLRHAAQHRERRLPRAQAAAQLVACAFFPFYDRRSVLMTILSAERAAAVPCFELWFARDRSIVGFVRRLIAGPRTSSRPDVSSQREQGTQRHHGHADANPPSDWLPQPECGEDDRQR